MSKGAEYLYQSKRQTEAVRGQGRAKLVPRSYFYMEQQGFPYLDFARPCSRCGCPSTPPIQDLAVQMKMGSYCSTRIETVSAGKVRNQRILGP